MVLRYYFMYTLAMLANHASHFFVFFNPCPQWLNFFSLHFSLVSCYTLNMTVTQTIKVPADRRVFFDVPREIPEGSTARCEIHWFPQPANQRSDAPETSHPCPICAAHIDPATGNPRYNAKTVAAIEEGIAISNGEIPAKRFHSLAEMLEDLDRDDPDDLDD